MYAIFNDQSFNDTLTNNVVSFEQLGPEYQMILYADRKTLIRLGRCAGLPDISLTKRVLKALFHIA